MRKLKSLSVLFFLFLILISATNPSTLISKSSSLEIKGYVYEKGEKIDGALVKLYQNNRVVQMVKTKNSKFQFILFSGMRYMIEVSKEEVITERIEVSTEEKTQFGGKYLYEFKVDLMSASKFKGVDISNLDFPTALIKYDIDEGEYMHDADYTKQVKAELKKLRLEAQAKK